MLVLDAAGRGDLVLTALHVVADRKLSPPAFYPGPILLQFPKQLTEATVVRFDPVADWALLRCKTAPGATPLPLCEVRESGGAFDGFGFPDARPVEGMAIRGEIRDHLGTTDGIWAQQLFCVEAAAGDGMPVLGISGSPCLVEGAIAGIVRSTLVNSRNKTVAGTLYACPTQVIAQACGDLLVPPRVLTKNRRTWDMLDRTHRNWLAGVVDSIGPDLRLPRPALLQELKDVSSQHRAVVLLGESGAGKSALVKGALSRRLLPGATWCLNAHEIERLDRETDLSNALREPPHLQAMLVIDGLEKLVDTDELRAAARVIHGLRLGEADSPWHLVVICQRSAWEDFRYRLIQAGCPDLEFQPIHVPLLEEGDLPLVAEQFPGLAPLLARRDLRPLVTRPKLLDLFARAAQRHRLPSVNDITGEASIIKWFWEQYVPRDIQRGALQRLAAEEADQRRYLTAVADLPAELETRLPVLTPLGILQEQDSAVGFAHDLVGDYTRQQFLLGKLNAGSTEELRKRAVNPRWHRPLRLVALHLLEMPGSPPTANIERWRQEVKVAREGKADVLTDLFVEAVAFTSRPDQLLETLKPTLLAEGGELLRRFLTRFLHATTEPFPIEQLGQLAPPELVAEYRARFRLPSSILLWVPVLSWIVAHSQETFTLAWVEVLRLLEVWSLMERRIEDLPLRQELADILLREAERCLAAEESDETVDTREAGTYYWLLLKAGRHDPERCKAIVRRLAGRTPRPRRIAKETMRPRPKSWPWAQIHGRKSPNPWPDGPRHHPDRDFQEEACTFVCAEQLIELGPEFATEVFLALFISVRRHDELRVAERHYNELDLERLRATFPPFHDFAPVSRLLARHPEAGLRLVVRLLDFASDRWLEMKEASSSSPEVLPAFLAEPKTPPKITLWIDDQPREFIGDERVALWHRGRGPSVAAAALMSLEKWLYERADARDLREEYLKLLIHSRSTAIIGVLIELALYRPSLLLGPLEFLVCSTDALRVARAMAVRYREHSDATMIVWIDKPLQEQQRAHEWHHMKHRAWDLSQTAAFIFARRDCRWPAIENARKRWAAERAAVTDSDDRKHLEEFDALFDPANWEQVEDAGRRAYQYHPPAALAAQSSRESQAAADRLARLTLPIRCQTILEGEATITEEELERLLVTARSLTNDAQQPEFMMLVDADTCRCGVAAVAFVRFSTWLEQHPAWKEECRSWLLHACVHPPSRLELDTRDSAGPYAWDHFCAEGVSRLWLSAPQDPELRVAITRLIAAFHYSAIGRLFQILGAERERLGEDFPKMLLLGLFFARRLDIIQYAQSFGPLTLEIPWVRELNSAWSAQAAAFVLGEAASAQELRVEEQPLSESKQVFPVFMEPSEAWRVIHQWRPTGLTITSPERRFPSLDSSYITAEFSWIRGNETGTLRALPLAHLLEWSKRVLGDIDWADEYETHVPYDDHQALLKRVGTAIVWAQNSHEREQLLLPWLILPEKAKYFLEEFLELIWRAAIDDVPLAPASLSAVGAVLDWALGKPDWWGWGHSDVACALLGASRRVRLSARWTAERSQLAESLSGRWRLWAKHAFGLGRAAGQFIHFLRTPAARGLRQDFLLWAHELPLDEALEAEEARDAMTAFLEQIAREQEPRLPAAGPTRDHFELLLTKLVGHRQPRAIQLATELAQSRGGNN